ncbi:hypothetical protein [Streptomyces sp. NPDC048644]|uniref:hypothetical protein n=1 Tax=Streptomyces sp. NPDC048644 TaxID=3365582 RepID=UPI00372435B7
MSEYEWDRTTRAVVASALAGDSDGAVELLRPLPQRDLCHIAVRLAAMTADALISAARDTGGDRADALSQWQRSILRHEAEHDGGQGPGAP